MPRFAKRVLRVRVDFVRLLIKIFYSFGNLFKCDYFIKLKQFFTIDFPGELNKTAMFIDTKD